MQRRSATPGLIFEALRVLHDTVGVLSDPERGAAMRAAGTAARRVALWRMRAVSSRSEFKTVSLRFVGKNSSEMMCGG